MISDDAVLELIFNPEHQGLSLESVAQTIDTRPSKYHSSFVSFFCIKLLRRNEKVSSPSC